MKKIMVLVTVAMMGAGFSGNVSAASAIDSVMKPVFQLMTDPVMKSMI